MFGPTNICEYTCRNSDNRAHMNPCVYAQPNCKNRGRYMANIYIHSSVYAYKSSHAHTHTNTGLKLSYIKMLLRRTSGNEL